MSARQASGRLFTPHRTPPTTPSPRWPSPATVSPPQHLAAADGPVGKPPAIAEGLPRSGQPVPPQRDPMAASPADTRSPATAVPSPGPAGRSRSLGQRRRADVRASPDYAATWPPSVAMPRPAAGAPAPVARVAAVGGTLQRNRGGSPIGSCESTSWHILRKTTGRTLPRRGTTRFRLSFGRGNEVRTGQTRVSCEHGTAIGAKWLRGEGGCLVGSVGLAEDCEANASTIEAIRGREEIAFRRHAAQDKVRVRLVLREKKTGGFDGCVGSLHSNLCGRQIAPHKNVLVRNLRERRKHGVTDCCVHGYKIVRKRTVKVQENRGNISSFPAV